MSKIQKVFSKKLSNSHSLSTIGNHLPHSNYSILQEKPISISPYPSKQIRSISIIKDPAAIHVSGMLSPPLKLSYTSSLKCKLNLNNSFLSKKQDLIDSSLKYKKKPIVLQKQHFCTDLDTSPYKKLEIIVKEHREKGMSSEIFKRYEECFEEIIHKDSNVAGLVAMIRFAYQDWIKISLGKAGEYEKLKEELSENNKKLLKEIEEGKRLQKRFIKINKENAEIGKELDQRDEKFRRLQEYLLQISSVDIEEVPNDRASWKVIVLENKSYAEQCAALSRKVKVLKKKEKKLVTLFWIIQKKGYPVEEIYDEMLNRDVKKANIQSVSDNSEYEIKNTEKSVLKPRPSVVPPLNMSKLEPNSFSDESSLESSDLGLSD